MIPAPMLWKHIALQQKEAMILSVGMNTVSAALSDLFALVHGIMLQHFYL